MGTIPSALFPILLKKKMIVVDPFHENFCEPHAYSLHIGSTIKVYDDRDEDPIDPLKMEPVDIDVSCMHTINLADKENNYKYAISPGQFVLAESFEYVGVHETMEAEFNGSSSLRRLGVIAMDGDLSPGHGIENNFKYTICMKSEQRSKPVVLTSTYVDKEWNVHWGMHVGKIKFKLLEDPREEKSRVHKLLKEMASKGGIAGYLNYDKWKYGTYTGNQGPETSHAGDKYEIMRRKPTPLAESSRHRKGGKPSSLDKFLNE